MSLMEWMTIIHLWIHVLGFMSAAYPHYITVFLLV
jgi:hypothetical protein